MAHDIYINDTVRIKVTFADIDENDEKIDIVPVTVYVEISNSNDVLIVDDLGIAQTDSIYYFDFTPTTADTFNVKFTGLLDNGDVIVVQQKITSVETDGTYVPTATLNIEEVINYITEIDPLYLNPEEILDIYPEASLAEISEIVYHYSSEIKSLLSLSDDEDGSNLPFIALEYIKAATACELSRTYEFGGGDEISITLADLTITNRSIPRSLATRDNASTWCQLAAAYRKEVLYSKAGKTGPRSIQPKGIPGSPVTTSGGYRHPDTGKIIYLSDRDLYGPGRNYVVKDDQLPDRDLRSYD